MKKKYFCLLVLISILSIGSVKAEESILCKRATHLHTEVCYTHNTVNKTGCEKNYNEGDTVTYGNLGSGNSLATGDAFDCDVNGDGTYDSTSERFYYVSGLDGNSNSDTKVLIYYNSINRGSSSSAKYYSSNENWHGPVGAVDLLPTIRQWNNTKLLSVNNDTDYARTIKSWGGEDNPSTSLTTSNGSKIIENPFVYKNSSGTKYAARFLSAEEAYKSCSNNLSNCKFLLENTDYTNNLFHSYWLENPNLGDSFNAYIISGSNVQIGFSNVNWSYLVRPVIEVPLSRIQLVEKTNSQEETVKEETTKEETTKEETTKEETTKEETTKEETKVNEDTTPKETVKNPRTGINNYYVIGGLLVTISSIAYIIIKKKHVLN